MVFAAGIGSRLKELTRDTPKCLMQAGDKTMLEHVVDHLKRVGVTELAINVHHHAQKVIEFVQSRGNFGIHVTFSPEESLLDTGGGLKRLRSFFESEEAFFVHNADVYCTTNLNALLKHHREHKALATLAVMRRESARGLFFDNHMRLVGWTGENTPRSPSHLQLAFGGISVCSGEIFNYMDSRDRFSIIESFLVAARATNRVRGVEIDPSTWIDIGTPAHLAELQSKWK